MKKNTKIWGIHYNWYPHPTAGEIYHHYYLGATYEAPNYQHVAEVTQIEDLGKGEFRISFDNGVDIKQNNINQIIIIPDDFSEKDADGTGSGGRTDKDEQLVE
jgi:hypothetical protein